MELIEKVLRAGERSAEEVEVWLAEGTGVSAELKREKVAIASGSRDWAISIRTIDHGQIGASAASSPAKWEECLAAALASMRLATPQEWKGLPGPAELRRKAPSFDERVVPEPSVAREFLKGMLGGAGEHPGAAITSGSASLSRSGVTIANSHGVLYTAARTEAGCSLEAISGQSTGSEFDHSPFLEIDPRRVGEKAAFLAVHSAGGEPLATGQYDVLLSPVALAQLLGSILVPALSGRTVHAGRSRLAPLLGQQCMDTRIRLFDDPFAKGMGATAWDAEGMPAGRLHLVKDGVLTSFAYDLKTAYRFGAKPTGSAIRAGPSGAPSIGFHNLVLDGPREEIASERALYVHDVVGAHTANPVSGDFSVECQNPAWVEGGEIGAPVRKAMLSGNLFDALREIGGIAEGSRIVGHYILPCMRFRDLQIIG